MIRPARAADADALVELEETCQGADAWSENLVREGVTGGLPTITWLVAGALDGYAVASYVGDVVELQRIGVAPAARRQGLAGELLDAVLERADEAERVVLEVREDNDGALAFYAAHGFTELARRPRYYRDGVTAVVLALDLTGRMSS